MLALKRIPFLVNLGWAEINQIIEVATVREYLKDERFVVKGQPINRLYILIEGELTK